MPIGTGSNGMIEKRDRSNLHADTLYVIAPDAEIDWALAEENGEGIGIFRAASRRGALVVSADSASLLRAFAEPATVSDAMIAVAEDAGAEATEVLKAAFPLLKQLVQFNVLVPAAEVRRGIPAWIEERLPLPGGWNHAHTVRIMDDSAALVVARGQEEAFAKLVTPDAEAETVLAREERVLSHLQDAGLERHVPRTMGDPPGTAGLLITNLAPGKCLAGISSRAWDLERRLALVGEILRLYEALHGAGVAHVDVHSGNVMVDGDHVTLIDFGSARAEEIGVVPSHRAVASTCYDPVAATEMLAGRRAPPGEFSSDIYAIGALSYEIITGDSYLDFPATRHALYRAIAEAPPRPFALHSVSAPNVEAVLMRALHKEAGARFASVSEFRQAFAIAAKRDLADDANKREAPAASLAFGSAGAALVSLQQAAAGADQAGLSAADGALARARSAQERQQSRAFLWPEEGLGQHNVSKGSVLHGPNGLALAETLAAFLWGDAHKVEALRGNFILASPQDFGLDLFLGDLGTFAAVAAFGLRHKDARIDTWMAESARHLVARASLAYRQDQPGSLGLAHGLGGAILALLLYRMDGGAVDDNRLRGLIELLARQSVTFDGGFTRWPWGHRQGGEAFYMPGLCSGDAGFLLLWSLIETTGLHDRAGEFADGSARVVSQVKWETGHLCCGAAGGAVGYIAHHWARGNTAALEEARRLAQTAAALTDAGKDQSFLKGKGGAELVQSLAQSANPAGCCLCTRANLKDA